MLLGIGSTTALLDEAVPKKCSRIQKNAHWQYETLTYIASITISDDDSDDHEFDSRVFH